MSSKWCVIVFVLWTTAFAIGSESKPGNNGISGKSKSDHGHFSSSFISLSDHHVKQTKISDQRVKRETEGMTLKVRLANGSYIYRWIFTFPNTLYEYN